MYVLSKDEGGRRAPPFFKGYRPPVLLPHDRRHRRRRAEGGRGDGPGDDAEMTVELIQPIAMDEGLRFAIREGQPWRPWCRRRDQDPQVARDETRGSQNHMARREEDPASGSRGTTTRRSISRRVPSLDGGVIQRRRCWRARVPLPTEKNVYYVIRGPFKDKDSREHFEIRTHKRLIDIDRPTPKTVHSLMRLDPGGRGHRDQAVGVLPRIIGTQAGDDQSSAEDGRVVPLTVIEAGPCPVLPGQARAETDGYRPPARLRRGSRRRAHSPEAGTSSHAGAAGAPPPRVPRAEGTPSATPSRSSRSSPAEHSGFTGTSKGKGYAGR